MSLWRDFSTPGGRYVYDTSTNKMFAVDPEVDAVLRAEAGDESAMPAVPGDSIERARAEIADARAQGMFRTRNYTIESFAADEMDCRIADLVSHGPDQLILNVTEACNLRCRYCTYSGAYFQHRSHGQRGMKQTTARKAAAWYLGHEAREKFTLSFYGGEPLLRLRLIDELVRSARAQVGDRVNFSLTTNATLLDEAACRLLVDANFSLMISLDGPAPIHDRYRRTKHDEGTFETIWRNIELLRRLDERYFQERVRFNFVLAPPVDLDALDAFITAHPDMFRYDNMLFAPVSPQPSDLANRLDGETDLELQRRQHEALWSRFGAELGEGVKTRSPLAWASVSNDFVPLHQRVMSVLPDIVPSHGQCTPGGRKCFIDTDGAFFMCERVAPAWPIGHVDSGFALDRIRAVLEDYDRFYTQRCGGCWAVRLCAKCVNSIRTGDELSPERSAVFCETQRRHWRNMLTYYASAREHRDDIFAWAEDVVMD